MNIILTGFMGTGKSAVARELSSILNRPVIDTDAEIERKTGKKISAIFADRGEKYFRRIEREVIRKVCRGNGRIIAVGGGAVIDKENRRNFSRNALVVNLTAAPKIISRRLKGDQSRPLLNRPQRQKIIRGLLAEREKYYQMCDLRINTDAMKPPEIAEKIFREIKKYEKDLPEN